METKHSIPRYITRMNLVQELNYQYGGMSPFVIDKDGKDVYDFQNDLLTFTCCKNGYHKHKMPPIKMLQLKYLYGTLNPCPLCQKNGDGLIRSDSENGSVMAKNKKYLESSDPKENTKRIAQYEAEVNEKIAKQENEIKRLNGTNKPQRTIQEWEKKEIKDDPIIESEPYDEYVNKNGEITNEEIDPIVEDFAYDETSDPIIESEPYVDNDPIIDSVPTKVFNGGKLDPYESGEESVSNYIQFLKNEDVEETNNREFGELDHPNANNESAEAKLTSMIENKNLNESDTNILLNETNNNSSLDEEEDIDLENY